MEILLTLTRDGDGHLDTEVINNEGAANLIVVRISPHDQPPPQAGCLRFVGLQGYPGGSRPGRVNLHAENPDVWEMYFPITGSFDAHRGGATNRLIGEVDLTNPHLQYFLTVEDGRDPHLKVVDDEGEATTQIKPFVIPPGTLHGTEKVDGSCRFLALKIERSVCAE